MSCSHACFFAGAQEAARQIGFSCHRIVRASAPVHTVLLQLTPRAFFVLVATPLYDLTPAHAIKTGMHITHAELAGEVLADESFARIYVPAGRETPLRFSHATPVGGIVSPFQKDDDFAVNVIYSDFPAVMETLTGENHE